jgi:CBS domain containing-hemolysin-like protein
MRDLLAKFNGPTIPGFQSTGETLDDVAGMIHVKDFALDVGRGAKLKLRQRIRASPYRKVWHYQLAIGIYREVLFVPPSMPAAVCCSRCRPRTFTWARH